MRTKILGPLVAPLLLLTGCGDESVTAPRTAAQEVLEAKQQASSHDLIALDGRWTQTTGINDAGTVVGRKLVGREVVDERSEGEEWEAALWEGGVATTLGIPRSTFVGINNSGTGLVLEKTEDYGALHGYLYRDGGVVRITGEHLGDWAIGEGFLTGSLDDDRMLPMDINDAGLVIARGAALRDGQTWYYAFAWQEASAITYIRGGAPIDVNNHGRIVGYAAETYHPVVWTTGSYDEPQIVPGLRDHFPGYEIELLAVNDSEQILGIACKRDDYYFSDEGEPTDERVRLCNTRIPMTYDRRGFVLDGGAVVELSMPRRSELYVLKGFNDSASVVGTVRKREGSDTNYVPVLWTVSAGVAAVQELPRGEYTHALAIAINGLGEVAGHANPWEALLWTPAPDKDDGGDGECTHPKGKCS